MKLKAKLATLDGLDENLKGLYVERDGAFVLDVEGVEGLQLEDTKALRTALSREKENVAALRTQLQPFRDEEGNLLDPEAAREALDKVSKGGGFSNDEERRAAVEAAVKPHLQKFEREKGQLQELLDARTDQLRGELKTNRNRAALTSAKLRRPESAEMLLPHLNARTEVVEEEDGKRLSVRYLDDDGKTPLYSAADPNKLMDPTEFVAGLKAHTVYGTEFASDSPSGGGTPPNRRAGSAGGGDNNSKELEGLTPVARLQRYHEQQAAARQKA